MRRIAVVLFAVALSVVGVETAQSDTGDMVTLTAALTGAAMVGTAGDPDGQGSAVFQADPDENELCYELTYSGISEPNAGYVHRAAKGANGPSVIDLNLARNGDKACVVADQVLLDAIVSNPAGYYVNLKTAEHSAGALRGQLTRQS